MRYRIMSIFLILALVCCLNNKTNADDAVVTVSPTAPMVGDKVTISAREGIEIVTETWKIKSPASDVPLKGDSKGFSFTPDKEGKWSITFDFNISGIGDVTAPENHTVNIEIKKKTAEAETSKKESTTQAEANRFQAGVNKLLKDSLVFYFDENYSKNVMTLAKEFRAKNPEIQKVADQAAIINILDSIENNFLENELKGKSEDVKNAWKNFFNALRRRLDITLQVFKDKQIELDKFAPLVQRFADALMNSAEQELTRIENYEVNRATYLNYMNKYSDGDSRFKKHHKYRKYRRHKHFYYKN